MTRDTDLIAQIEHDALDDNVPVATALRKCVVLGGQSGSEALRDWATRELKGYQGEDDLPDYRVINAPLMVDGIAGNYKVEHQQFPASAIPDFAKGVVSERVELRDGAGSLEALAQRAQIRLQPSGASDLTRLMNHEANNPYQQIISLYWSIAPPAVHGVLDQIRTSLTQLVAELRATMPGDSSIPSAEQAANAVQVIVTGKRNRVHVGTATATGDGSTATATADTPGEPETGFWTRWRKIGAFLVGAATITGTIVAILNA